MVVFGLIIGVIPPPKHAFADSSRIVSIYFDGQKKVITTEATTVSKVLNQSGVVLSAGDIVEPAPSTAIPVGFFNVNVYRSRPVVVVDGKQEKIVHTASQSPAIIAQSAGFKTFPEDLFAMSVIDEVTDEGVVGQKVIIDRAISVNIVADGQTQVVRTQQTTVGGLLDERDVALGPQDTIEPPRATPISPNMIIKINRIKTVVVKETKAIAREVKTIKDPNVDAGITRVQTEGADGQKELTFRINYQNGIEKKRELLTQSTLSQPVAKVVVVGSRINYSADPVSLGKQMAAERGWTGDQWNALYSLWDRESGWNPAARNSWSGACGIPQAYPCSKITDMSAAGQIRWGLNYVSNRYGSPSAAWAYWLRNNSY